MTQKNIMIIIDVFISIFVAIFQLFYYQFLCVFHFNIKL